MLEQFSATIDKIYAAAGDSSLWEEALRAVEDYTGSTGAVLNLVPKDPAITPMALAGSFSRSDCAEYATNYMWRCPRIAFAQVHPDIPIHYDRMILTESEMDRDATYEWYGKHGLRYYVAGWLGDSATHRAYMSLQRSWRQGHVEPEHVEQFALVLKHMARALTLAVKLGTLDQQTRLSLDLLEALPHAVFALDGKGRVLLTNSQANRMLRQEDGLILRNGYLQCRPEQQQLLDRLIEKARSSDATGHCGGWTWLHRPSGRRPYVAVISRIEPFEEMFGAFRPEILVIVSEPGQGIAPDEPALQALFHLTEAEARLASALGGGHSLASASALLRLQSSTARTHLKAVFRKMGVNRQQDLVRVIATLPAAPPAA